MLWLLVAVALARPEVCPVGSADTGKVAGHTWLVYVTGKQLAAIEARRAEAERRPPEVTPVHGVLVLRYRRQPVQLANPDNQVVVVESNGQQLLRTGPDWPERPVWLGYQPRWRALVVPLPDEAAFPLEVHAADRALGHACSWQITWEGRVERL